MEGMDYKSEVVALTKKFIEFNTINPPGNEMEIARYAGGLLKEYGFQVSYIPYQEGRIHVVADMKGTQYLDPVIFTGHFDTVPLGQQAWKFEPLKATVHDGKLYGRGSTDMKGAVAAMIVAAKCALRLGQPKRSVRFILTADEELGCNGALDLVKRLPSSDKAYGIIVGEPTNNIPAIGHKGGIYLRLKTTGVTAHSSMPDEGDNAIYKMARAITKIEDFQMEQQHDPLLGLTTLNVGYCQGGMNLNSVPDKAAFTIDARTTTKMDHDVLLAKIQETVGEGVSIETLVNLKAIASEESHAFVQQVYNKCGYPSGQPRAMPYLTDGSVLQEFFGGIPTIIIGPGDPKMAHKTDEYCRVDKLQQAVEIYRDIIISEQ